MFLVYTRVENRYIKFLVSCTIQATYTWKKGRQKRKDKKTNNMKPQE